MSFAIRNLSVLAYANGFTLWHYRTPGRVIDTVDVNYFAKASDMLTVGDIVMVSGPEGALQLVVSNIGLESVVVKSMARTE